MSNPTPLQPHRRLRAGGYARGEETRLRIIQAAVELFGAKGYEATSTREIAARAGVNAPALQYYFAGKEGLYLACAEHMAERCGALFAPVIARVRERLAAKPSTDALIDCVCTMLDRAMDFVLMATELDSWARFIAWEDLGRERPPASARAIFDKGPKRDIQDLMCQLVGRIIGKRPDSAQTRLYVLTLGSQAVIFHASRERALSDLGWNNVDAKRLKMIKSVIRRQASAALKAAARRN